MYRLLFVASLSLVSLGSLPGQGWIDRTPSNSFASPSQRFDAAMAWDAGNGYMLLFGGVSYMGNVFPNDTWSWNGSAWTQRFTITQPNTVFSSGSYIPVVRRPAAMAYHSPTSQVVLVAQGETYRWSGSNWLPAPGGIPSAISSPGTPINLAMGRDEGRNQTVLFVGSHVVNNAGNPILQPGSETLLWDGFTWTLRATATHPYPAEQPSMTFDSGSGRLLLCTTDATNSQSYFWEWNGTNWTQRSVASHPTAGGVLATDVARGQVVMLDGSLNPSPNHTWTIGATSGQQLGLTTEPSRRQAASCAFDPVRGRMVVFGGFNAPFTGTSLFALADTWEFELGAGASYTSYGTGCAGSRGIPSIAAQGTSLPHAGSIFTLQVNNVPLTGPVFMFAGISNAVYGPTPLPLSLASYGAPGCSVLASGEALYLLTNVLGSAVWQFPVPNALGVSFYNQAFAFDPSANALGLTASNGGMSTIGF